MNERRHDGTWSEWEVVRRQVAVCGRVTAEPALLAKVEVRAQSTRVDKKVDVRDDGIYFFLDLPSGDYVVTVVEGEPIDDNDVKVFVRGTGHVSRNAQHDVAFAWVDLDATPPTARPQARHGRRRRNQ